MTRKLIFALVIVSVIDLSYPSRASAFNQRRKPNTPSQPKQRQQLVSTVENKEAENEWAFILAESENYYMQNRKEDSFYVAFAHQFFLIAKIAYNNRKEKGGWATDFTRKTFVFAYDDIKKNQEYWMKYPSDSKELRSVMICIDLNQDFNPFDPSGTMEAAWAARRACYAVLAGKRHMERHLKPHFESYIRSSFLKAVNVIQIGAQTSLRQRILAEIRRISVEHESFLAKAVVPAFDKVLELATVYRNSAKVLVPQDARTARNSAIAKILLELRDNRLISNDDYSAINSSWLPSPPPK